MPTLVTRQGVISDVVVECPSARRTSPQRQLSVWQRASVPPMSRREIVKCAGRPSVEAELNSAKDARIEPPDVL
jgi:hypothetical protein